MTVANNKLGYTKIDSNSELLTQTSKGYLVFCFLDNCIVFYLHANCCIFIPYF